MKCTIESVAATLRLPLSWAEDQFVGLFGPPPYTLDQVQDVLLDNGITITRYVVCPQSEKGRVYKPDYQMARYNRLINMGDYIAAGWWYNIRHCTYQARGTEGDYAIDEIWTITRPTAILRLDGLKPLAKKPGRAEPLA